MNGANIAAGMSVGVAAGAADGAADGDALAGGGSQPGMACSRQPVAAHPAVRRWRGRRCRGPDLVADRLAGQPRHVGRHLHVQPATAKFWRCVSVSSGRQNTECHGDQTPDRL